MTDAKLDGFHFHDTRHHFASWYLTRSGTLPALQQIRGHADIKMTLRYAHLAPGHLRSEMEKTERPTQITAPSAQELVPAEGVSQKS